MFPFTSSLSISCLIEGNTEFETVPHCLTNNRTQENRHFLDYNRT